MRKINEILIELGVPEGIRALELEVLEGPREEVEHTRGGSNWTHHGYLEYFKLYDPYSQLQFVESVDTSDDYADSTKFVYSYKGEKPAAVYEYYTGVNTSHMRVYLYMPQGMEVSFEAKEKGNVVFDVPKNLLRKWINEACAAEKRNPRYWKRYFRVEKRVRHKALVYAAHKFAREHSPQQCGVVHDIWGGYDYVGGRQVYFGQSILIQDGQVKFVDVEHTYPDRLLRAYGIDEYFSIDANVG